MKKCCKCKGVNINKNGAIIIISNCSIRETCRKAFAKGIKELNLVPIFMYDNDFSNNSELELNDLKNSLYEDVIVYSQKDREKTVGFLKKYKIKIVAIIPASEEDVIDAEYFSEQIGTPSNPSSSSICRRDKYEMQQRIKEFGLTSIKQKLCSDKNDIIDFVTENPNIKYVIKPVHSSATEDVYLCDTLNDLCRKFKKIINKKNAMGLMNESCLVQEYIDGDEYSINTVSQNGIHKICHIFLYDKNYINERHFMYHQTTLINSKNLPRDLLVYLYNVLNALEIKNGVSHSEIKMSSKGPCLIELAARTPGETSDSISKCIVNYNSLINMSIYSYCNQELFNKIPILYSVTDQKYIQIVINNLYHDFSWDKKCKTHFNSLINNLKSVVSIEKIFYTPVIDEILFKTKDLLTSILSICIISDSDEKLDKAINMVREWEIRLIDHITPIEEK